MPAPTAMEGEKMPPGMPQMEDSVLARNFSAPKLAGGGAVPSSKARAWA